MLSVLLVNGLLVREPAYDALQDRQKGGKEFMSGCKFTKRIGAIPGKATWTSKDWAVAILAHIKSADGGLPTMDL
ncbi:Integrase catalytic core [Penicillium mononematosum]|uniref:Integrase catalytic core n=1 Tax=Penicillium mononematosum TaxID=268346 RepID=UPI00254843E2|nr:Integrase catalytic core [Penicillium mononematosum]KAJ6189131.1 Integrase catalytic core [Penicillium mononematosum]